MSIIDGTRVRWREWRERVAERKANQVSDPPNVTVPAWLVRATKFAAWVATASLIYFLWLYTLDVARDRAGSLHITHAGVWIGELQFWFPYICGFAVVAFGIPYVAKIAIPTFVSLTWRHDFTAKAWALIIALAVSLVVISGTFAVQGNTIMERDRDAAVAVEQVQQDHAALQARIDSRRQELADMMNNRNAYLAQAASVGAAEWERTYIAQARSTNDPRLPMIERALGAARSADTARAELDTLRQQLAQGQTVASVQREVVTERTGWIAQTLGWLEGVRAILLSFVMDIVALIMPLIALRLEQARNRQMGMAEGIPRHPWMLEDKTAEPKMQSDAFRSAQDVVDAMIAGGADPRFAADMARSAARREFRKTEIKDKDKDEIIVDEDGDLATIVREHTRKKRTKAGETIKVMVPGKKPDPDEAGIVGYATGTSAPGNTVDSLSDAVQGADNSDTNEGEGEDSKSESNFHPDDSVIELTDDVEELVAADDLGPPGRDASSGSEIGDVLTENLPTSEEVREPYRADEDNPGADEQSQQNQVIHDEPSPEREPETDPRRMIAAE